MLIMKILDAVLTPFVSLYRGVMSPFQKKKPVSDNVNTNQSINVFTSNTNNVTTGPTDVFNKNKKLEEIKPDEKVINRNEVRSAYETPKKPEVETNPVILAQMKQVEALKKQKGYNELVAKIREEEKRKVAEQEQIRIQNEKIARARLEKEQAMEKKDQEALAKQETIIAEKRKKGEATSLSERIKLARSKSDNTPKKLLEYEAKKQVLTEQLKSNTEAARFETPMVFDYLARNSKGELEKSSIEANSRVDVYSFLIAEGYDVYEIHAAKPKSISIGAFKFSKSKLVFYLSQLSAYLKSGIALADAVKLLEQQCKNVNEKKALRAVYYDLSNGDVLSVAMNKRGEAFPKLLINMIKTAEMTGNLTETLDDMVEYYSESEQTKKQMKSAMTYPLVVTIFAAIVITFILMWVVPQFVGIYEDLGSDLPSITKIVIAISDFLKNYLIFILIGVIILCLVIIYLYKNVIGFRRKMQVFTMKLPIFGNIIIYNEVTIFTKTFANLVNHNVFITDSMSVLSQITNNEIYKKLIRDTAKNLTKGEPISKAFKDQWAFPLIAYQMLITGEKTGRLGPMLEKVSEYYQEQHRNLINQMKSLIEPALIVFLAVVVGGILLSVIIPMYGMYDAL